MKYIKRIIVAALVILIGWQLYQKIFNAGTGFRGRDGSASVAVEVVPVKVGTINDEGLFTGSLLPWSQFTVAPKITGRLEEIYVNIGDKIENNELIAVLDDDEYVQQVGRYQAELAVAEASVVEARSSFELAEREYERAKILREKKIGSESELDNAEANYKAQEARYKVAVAQISQRKASLAEARVRLSYTKIRASWESKDKLSRVIGERFVHEGALLTPNSPIVSILDINKVLAIIHMVEKDYPKVKTGMEAYITTDAFPGKTFTGKVVRIAPQLKESSREARIEIEIPNDEWLLKPGMFTRVRIKFSTKDNAVIVPQSSLARREEKQGIFLADTTNMTAAFVSVTTGIVNGEYVEIVSPDVAGLVVNLGQHLLEDGSKITVSDAHLQTDDARQEAKPRRDNRRRRQEE